MKLNKDHREALLDRRDKLTEQLSITEECSTNAEKDSPLLHWWAIDTFLLEGQIERINKALINNEIDF